VLAGNGTRKRDAFQFALNRPVNLGLDSIELGHFDPAIAGLNADTVVAGLRAAFAFETRVSGFLLRVEEALEGLIEVNAGLLQRY
jgi:hypothetical protein